MAKVWFVREDSDPTTGAPTYELSLGQCTEQLDLEKKHWLHGLDRTPRPTSPSGRVRAIARARVMTYGGLRS